MTTNEICQKILKSERNALDAIDEIIENEKMKILGPAQALNTVENVLSSHRSMVSASIAESSQSVDYIEGYLAALSLFNQ